MCLTSGVVCKLCKKISSIRWIQCLEENAVVSAKQYGFREGTSCVFMVVVDIIGMVKLAS